MQLHQYLDPECFQINILGGIEKWILSNWMAIHFSLAVGYSRKKIFFFILWSAVSMQAVYEK